VSSPPRRFAWHISAAGIERQEAYVGLKTRTTGDRLSEVRDALRTARKGTVRSALYHWMRQNHDGLSALFEETTPAWAILAETFGGMGLTDRDGKIPTAKTARMTWYRVRLDVKRYRVRSAGCDARGPAPGFVTNPWTDSANPPRGPDPLMTPEDTRQDEPPPEPEFRFASPRAASQPGALSDIAKPPVSPQCQNPDEAIARLLARPGRGAIPMPDIPEPEDE
jgi:hypothetical protein